MRRTLRTSRHVLHCRRQSFLSTRWRLNRCAWLDVIATLGCLLWFNFECNIRIRNQVWCSKPVPVWIVSGLELIGHDWCIAGDLIGKMAYNAPCTMADWSVKLAPCSNDKLNWVRSIVICRQRLQSPVGCNTASLATATLGRTVHVDASALCAPDAPSRTDLRLPPLPHVRLPICKCTQHLNETASCIWLCNIAVLKTVNCDVWSKCVNCSKCIYCKLLYAL